MSLNATQTVTQSTYAYLEDSVENLLSQSTSQASIMNQIQLQMQEIETQNKAILDFFAVLNPETLIVKDLEGNVDLLGGNLEAEGVVAGTFTVKVTDEEKKTIGFGVICPAMTEIDQLGECTINQTDSDGDGLNDATGNKLNDGKTIKVRTISVSSTSKIFVTPKVATDQPLAVTNINVGESFTVEIKNPVSEKINFDWFLLEEKPAVAN